jgi:hypothetical protein
MYSAMFHLKKASGRRENDEQARQLELQGGGHDVVMASVRTLTRLIRSSDKIGAAFWRSLGASRLSHLPFVLHGWTCGRMIVE